MSRWLALLLALLAVAPAHAAISVVQTASCSAGGTTSCTTGAITTTAGNLLVANSSYCCAGFTSVTDNKSNTYGNAFTQATVDVQVRQDFIASAAGGASHTFTLTGASAAFYGTISVQEIAGAAAPPLDKTANQATAAGTSHSSGSTATTSQANELLIGVGGAGFNTTYTTDTGAGWTERTNVATDASHEGILVGTKVVAATGTYAYTFTTSASTPMQVGISTWKEAAAAAGVRQRCVGCGADGKVIE